MVLFDPRLKRSTRFWNYFAVFTLLLNAFNAVTLHSGWSLFFMLLVAVFMPSYVSDAKKELAALPVEDHKE